MHSQSKDRGTITTATSCIPSMELAGAALPELAAKHKTSRKVRWRHPKWKRIHVLPAIDWEALTIPGRTADPKAFEEAYCAVTLRRICSARCSRGECWVVMDRVIKQAHSYSEHFLERLFVAVLNLKVLPHFPKNGFHSRIAVLRAIGVNGCRKTQTR